MNVALSCREAVGLSLRTAPIIGVVRTSSRAEADRQARALLAGGVQLVEITFSVPDALGLVSDLLAEFGVDAAPWLGMGTVTTGERAEQAIRVGARFLVTPNVNGQVAALAKEADVFLAMGALTPTEIVKAHGLGADIVKVFPLPPVGGPAYLRVVRGPLADIPMLAAGGFPVDEIAAYREAGAQAFGLAAPLLGAGGADAAGTIARALRLAGREESR
jgi:2-dehydro-3-deoxyphosphogluconate aldolase / (4S)-4-hydroxy-2-oxoglutarate aldolase